MAFDRGGARFNASGITSINRLTGPQFGFAAGIVSARVARIGGGINF